MDEPDVVSCHYPLTRANLRRAALRALFRTRSGLVVIAVQLVVSLVVGAALGDGAGQVLLIAAGVELLQMALTWLGSERRWKAVRRLADEQGLDFSAAGFRASAGGGVSWQPWSMVRRIQASDGFTTFQLEPSGSVLPLPGDALSRPERDRVLAWAARAGVPVHGAGVASLATDGTPGPDAGEPLPVGAPAGESISCAYALTWSQYRQMSARAVPLGKVSLFLLGFLLLTAGLTLVGGGPVWVLLITVPVLAVVFVAVFGGTILWLAPALRWRRVRRFARDQRLEFSAEGTVGHSLGASARIPWSRYREVSLDRRLLGLWLTPGRRLQAVPRGVLAPEQEETVLGWAERAGVKVTRR